MQPLLKIQGLSKRVNLRSGLFRHKSRLILDDVSFCLGKGETVAIIGETGSGKTTLAKVLAGAERGNKGQILLNGELIEDDGVRDAECRNIRLIFQDPGSSLNPALTVGDTLSDCLELNTGLDAQQINTKIKQTLLKVGLLADHADYYPHMFSGGQLQRVAMARALILDPDIVVLDEALSSLDPSVRAQTVNLLLELQKESGLSYVLITHHLSLVRHMSDSVVVLENGRIVEYGPTEQVFTQPQSKTTQRLLSC